MAWRSTAHPIRTKLGVVTRHVDEQKIHGQHACRALFARRPDDIVRAYVARDQVEAFGDLLHTLAATRRSYKVVSPAELEKLTDSKHHEGICLLVKRRAVGIGEGKDRDVDRVEEPAPGRIGRQPLGKDERRGRAGDLVRVMSPNHQQRRFAERVFRRRPAPARPRGRQLQRPERATLEGPPGLPYRHAGPDGEPCQ